MAKNIDVEMGKYSIYYNPAIKKWKMVDLFTGKIYLFDTAERIGKQVHADLEDAFGESIF